jgi:cytochrome c551/c552
MRLSLALLLAAAILSACDSEPKKPRSELSGAELFSESRCGSCHGGDRRGSWMGPPLEGLAAHWSTEDLARYLRDPLPVIEATPRLSKMRRKYPATMRPFGELTKDERTRIARWLLATP